MKKKETNFIDAIYDNYNTVIDRIDRAGPYVGQLVLGGVAGYILVELIYKNIF